MFIMGFTTPVPPHEESEIQSFVGMLNFYQLGSKFIKKNPRIFLIKGHEIPYIFNTKGGN